MEKKNITKNLISRLEKICGKKKRSLHEPSFFGNELYEIKSCIKSTYVSSKSGITSRFEEKIRKITKAKYVVATVNGTAALHMGLISMNLKSNEEVFIPSFNFVAEANAIN